MPWAAAAVIGGALISADASSNASDAQQQSADQANQTQRDQYNQTRADQAPWRAAGQTALGQMSAGTAPGGQFTQTFGDTQYKGDPGYQFRLQQGQDALDNQAASRGRLLSGAQLKAASEYNQNFASNEYGNAYNRFMDTQNTRFNRLASLAGVGQTANSLIAQSGQNMANNVSANQIGAGNARASGYMGAANAFNSGVGSYMNYNNNQRLINSMTPQSQNSPVWNGGDNALSGYNWAPSNAPIE